MNDVVHSYSILLYLKEYLILAEKQQKVTDLHAALNSLILPNFLV